METESYEDEYFSHLSSIESKEESERNSERFLETEKILRKITEEKNKAQNLPKPTQAGPAGKPQVLPTSSNKEENDGKNQKPRNPRKGKNRHREIKSQT
ncbi:hypothetical protein JTB14_015405 [Gonioctena quinquepunctata]|nr:hypothetical protein JTB14_015405 [Gonioctena quinquepunctata]